MGTSPISEFYNEEPKKGLKGFQKWNVFSRFKGKRHSEETKEKMRAARFLNNPMKDSSIAKKMSETRIKRGCSTRESNHNWKGGDRKYRGPKWAQQREARKALDNYTCQDCGKKEIDQNRSLDVHHVVDFKDGGDNSIDNLLTLCRSCHNKRRKKTQ